MPFAIYDMSDPTSGIFHIMLPAWNQMGVAMKYGLASNLATINADVKTLYTFILF